MSEKIKLNELDKVEILSLMDNYIDFMVRDNSNTVKRVGMVKDGIVNNSIFAEHGFSAIIKTEANAQSRSMLFDFGFSAEGAAYNAKKLGIDMTVIEEMALSHGHSDHTGSIAALTLLIGKKGIRLVAHPQAFVSSRYLKVGKDFKIKIPLLSKEKLQKEGIKVEEAAEPVSLLGGNVLFLSEIPRLTDFEKGMPNAYYAENGVEKIDTLPDDTSLVMNLKGRGLIILSGCAHAGIINTVYHARKVTGIDSVHAVMGGFHLSGPHFEPLIEKVIAAFKEINPHYIIPTHCTGRKAINAIEKEFPGKFLLNMSGTTLTFN
jgi:7,8-dihydropterin-6-yl-methyl-4-(beta-D-ribofuranosyl)aminobenzene 5'-phosphate synthase